MADMMGWRDEIERFRKIYVRPGDGVLMTVTVECMGVSVTHKVPIKWEPDNPGKISSIEYRAAVAGRNAAIDAMIQIVQGADGGVCAPASTE